VKVDHVEASELPEDEEDEPERERERGEEVLECRGLVVVDVRSARKDAVDLDVPGEIVGRKPVHGARRNLLMYTELGEPLGEEHGLSAEATAVGVVERGDDEDARTAGHPGILGSV
jgi:hypothetical protein